MKHLSLEDMLAYVAGNLEEEEMFRCEVHLSECGECVSRVRNYHVLRADFDGLWDSWSLNDQVEEVLVSQIRESLSRLKVSTRLEERLSTWLLEICQRTRAVLGISIDSSRKTVTVLQEVLGRLGEVANIAPFSAVPAPTRVLGSEDTGLVSFETRDPSWVNITIDPTIRKITVRGQYLEETLPLVLLIPRGKGEPFVEESRRIEESDDILVEFEGVPDGDYIILLESTTHAT